MLNNKSEPIKLPSEKIESNFSQNLYLKFFKVD